jgi:hypothetical protein
MLLGLVTQPPLSLFLIFSVNRGHIRRPRFFRLLGFSEFDNPGTPPSSSTIVLITSPMSDRSSQSTMTRILTTFTDVQRCFEKSFTMEATCGARHFGETGVQLPSPPLSLFERKCHAVALAKTAGTRRDFLPALKPLYRFRMKCFWSSMRPRVAFGLNKLQTSAITAHWTSAIRSKVVAGHWDWHAHNRKMRG